MGTFKSYKIYIKPGFEKISSILNDAAKSFINLIEESPDIKDDSILNIVYGGDGTLIKAIEENKYKGYFISIKSSNSLGFFTEFKNINELIDYKEIFTPFIEKHKLLEVTGNNKTFFCVNEFIFSNPYATMKFSLAINNIPFCYCASNGICVSTPFGSTGYNHSLGGTILLSNDGYEYNIIAPIENNLYHNSLKSICLNENDILEINMENKIDITIASDMKVIDFGKDCTNFKVKKTNFGFYLVHLNEKNVYNRLRNSFAMKEN